MDPFVHLSEERVNKMMKDLMAEGLTKDEAFTEIYAVDCQLDQEDE